ncbi:MAG: NAD(P)H-hydrate dehydratase [Chloroflexi bacterium]|nr:NAD(P)H-hydrate dehydratase [Chloroflexota bacterium]
MKIVTVDQMRRIEASSDAGGHSYAAMMELAGQAVAQAIITRRQVCDRQVLVLVGSGNNGGDGLVAARYLVETGARVMCYLLKPRDPVHDENFYLVQQQGLEIVFADQDKELANLRHMSSNADIIVDALLGTGARLPLRGTLAEMLGIVRRTLTSRRQSNSALLTRLIPPSVPGKRYWPFVVAVDGPSGLDYDNGALDEAAIPADITVTFAYPKPGHFVFPGASGLGELLIADIDTDPTLADDVMLELVTPGLVQQWLPLRPLNAHKGTFGKTLIIAGSANYTGAAYLAGAAATRAGAGLVTLAVPNIIYTPVSARLAEATYLRLPCEQELGAITIEAVSIVTDQLENYDALLLGPGLGQARMTRAFVETLLSKTQKGTHSLVVDADGLNILAEMKDWPKQLPATSILTPHPGEMARLTGCTIGEIQADRVTMAQSQAAAWGHVIVLKGAYTVVAAPDGRTDIIPFANPGLATAGTGDVLAGTIVALRAQGVSAFEAAAAGAYLHGLAGELARLEFGAAGMVASDVLAHLPQAWQQIFFN